MKNLPKYIVVGILVLLCVIYLFSRCTLFIPDTEEKKDKDEVETVIPSMAISDEIKQKVEEMSLEEKIYQMFYVTPEQLTGVGEVIQAGDKTKEMLEKYPVGGIVYSSHNLQTPEQTKELIGKSQEYSKIPMFAGVFEEGGNNTVLGDNSSMSLGKIEAMSDVSDFERAYEIGAKVGNSLLELGINMNFAPVADVMGEGINNIIGTRSFGNDYNAVSRKVEQYVKGLQSKGVSATLKHFPGQGYTEGDTSYDYAKNNRSAKEIRKEEFAPFIKGIGAGADFVMIGNVKVGAFDSDNPAPFSYKIVTELLKSELGYTGIVISSPMTDGAVLNSHTSADAAKEAVKAGVDMILMPNSLEIAVKALCEAVESGEIPESRINESVMKILQTKVNRGIL